MRWLGQKRNDENVRSLRNNSVASHDVHWRELWSRCDVCCAVVPVEIGRNSPSQFFSSQVLFTTDIVHVARDRYWLTHLFFLICRWTVDHPRHSRSFTYKRERKSIRMYLPFQAIINSLSLPSVPSSSWSGKRHRSPCEMHSSCQVSAY